VGARVPAGAVAPVGKEKVWGAAELDFLTYVCGATGKGCPEKTKVVIEPARTLDKRLAASLASVPFAVATTEFGIKEAALREAVVTAAGKLEPFYQRRARFDPADLSNQYAFDFDSVLTWSAVLAILPPSKLEAFQRAVGAKALQAVREAGAKAPTVDGSALGLDTPLAGCLSLLKVLKEKRLIDDFTFDAGDYDPAFWKEDSPPTSVELTFDSPATMQACLQMGGQGARLTPDYVAAVLTAYLEECGVSAEYSSYFVDKQYRPNLDDYQPTQVLAQMNLRPKIVR